MKSIKFVAACFLGLLISGGGIPTYAEDFLLYVPVLVSPKKPRAPTNLGGIPGIVSTTNILWWDDNSSNESGFIVERMDGMPILGVPGNYSRIGLTSRNIKTFYDSSITPGKSYTYRVKAYNRKRDSNYSGHKTLTCTTPRPPIAPSNLTAVAASSNSINLNWDFAGDNAESWYIERSNGCTGVFSQVGALYGANLRFYQDSWQVGPGQSYCYRVQAANWNPNHPDGRQRLQRSGYSNVASATPQDTTGTPVLSGPSSATREFNISWSFTWPAPGNDDDHYQLEQSHISATSGFQLVPGGIFPNGDRTSPYVIQMQPDATDIGTTLYLRVGAWVDYQMKYSNAIAVQVPKISISLYPTFDNLMQFSSVNSAYQTTSFPSGKLRVGSDFFCLQNSYIDPTTGNILYYWTDAYTRDASALWFGEWFGTELSTFIQGRTIFSAKLNLTPANVGLPRKVGVLLFSQAWDDATLTFNNCPAVWTTPMAEVWAPTNPNVPMEIDVTTLVQAWATGGKANYGFLVRDNHNNGIWTQEIGNFLYGFDIYSQDTAPIPTYKPRLDLEIR